MEPMDQIDRMQKAVANMARYGETHDVGVGFHADLNWLREALDAAKKAITNNNLEFLLRKE